MSRSLRKSIESISQALEESRLQLDLSRKLLRDPHEVMLGQAGLLEDLRLVLDELQHLSHSHAEILDRLGERLFVGARFRATGPNAGVIADQLAQLRIDALRLHIEALKLCIEVIHADTLAGGAAAGRGEVAS